MEERDFFWNNHMLFVFFYLSLRMLFVEKINFFLSLIFQKISGLNPKFCSKCSKFQGKPRNLKNEQNFRNKPKNFVQMIKICGENPKFLLKMMKILGNPQIFCNDENIRSKPKFSVKMKKISGEPRNFCYKWWKIWG